VTDETNLEVPAVIRATETYRRATCTLFGWRLIGL